MRSDAMCARGNCSTQESLNTIMYHVESSCTHLALAATFCLIANLVSSSIQGSGLPDLVRDGVIFHAGLPDYRWAVTFCRISRARVPRIPRVFPSTSHNPPSRGNRISVQSSHKYVYSGRFLDIYHQATGKKQMLLLRLAMLHPRNTESEPGNFLGHVQR